MVELSYTLFYHFNCHILCVLKIWIYFILTVRAMLEKFFVHLAINQGPLQALSPIKALNEPDK